MSLADSRALMLAAILPAATDRYVALFNGDPSDGGAEVDLVGYERQAHANWLTADNGTDSTRENVGAIEFGPITEDGIATHWAIFDEEFDGVLLRSGPLRETAGGTPIEVEITTGDSVRIPSGNLIIRLTEGEAI